MPARLPVRGDQGRAGTGSGGQLAPSALAPPAQVPPRGPLSSSGRAPEARAAELRVLVRVRRLQALAAEVAQGEVVLVKSLWPHVEAKADELAHVRLVPAQVLQVEVAAQLVPHVDEPELLVEPRLGSEDDRGDDDRLPRLCGEEALAPRGLHAALENH
eukprot:CAMPEP_0206040002 /NCGR_PEP_ID=MMETSP1466-20131121/5122_1 /ASSEMBLY_ACC=CAM_ASM_001126 /TAXON_ID=44452 /ORGANISM="Pavlova gyrans, Strain CCMP608" /LENGTH=158 /DNA_ID=CAMNT_0053414661 /DNA_START=56 /DNA_END=530 /DNA_ORIENTATION=-